MKVENSSHRCSEPFGSQGSASPIRERQTCRKATVERSGIIALCRSLSRIGPHRQCAARCHRPAPMLYRLARPALFTLDPERAHRLAIAALRAAAARRRRRPAGRSRREVAGLAFPNPLGMAAGFDKDGEVPDALLGLGFGFAEVGSITPRPQAGNPQAAAVPPGRGPRGDQPHGLQQRRRARPRRRGWRRAQTARDRRHQHRRQQGFGRPRSPTTRR